MSRHQGIVKEFFDTNFGEVTKLEQLSNARQIYDQLLEKQRDIEHQLSVIRTEVPTKIESAIRLSDAKLSQGEALIARKDELVQKIHDALTECAPMEDELGGMVMQVKEIEKFIMYLQWIERVEKISAELQDTIQSSLLSNACKIFQRLLIIEQSLTDHNTKCESLQKFVTDTIFFWNKILREKLTEKLDVVLKKIKWPFVLAPGPRNIPKMTQGTNGEKGSSKSSSTGSTSMDLSAEFERIFLNLLLIQMPDHLLVKQNAQTEGSSDQNTLILGSQILLPLQLMLRPLRKRFRYHFSGKKQTNSISKPEWYLTQVLNWVGNHKDFLEHTVQGLLDSQNYNSDALVMFTRGLLQLVCRKLSEDMNELLYNDDLFSHSLDEVLLFDRELRGSYDFSPLAFRDDNPLNVFMSAECIQKWISIEKLCALDRLDSMLSSANAWESKYGSKDGEDKPMEMDNSDESMVPECAELFIAMLLTITDRYKYIPDVCYQLRFLDLQLHLLDDFRIRLSQVLKNESSDSPLGERHFGVLNAAYYVALVLRDWAENSFFLELKVKRDGESAMETASEVVPQSLLSLGERRTSRSGEISSAVEEDSVFDGMLKLYDRLYKDGIEHVAKIVCSEFEIKGWTYVSESWLTLPSKEEQLTLVVSRSACSMLLVLQERLHLLSLRLCSSMFSSCWRKIAEKVDYHLFHQVVLRNRFNIGGALQLQFDMTRNLFPLFSSYTQKPENYFRRMKESCILLNLQAGSAMLLSEVLNTANEMLDGDQDPNASVVKPSAALHDIGISLLTPQDATAIMKLRIDYPQNNM